MDNRYINIGFVKDILTKKTIKSLNEDYDIDKNQISEFIDTISNSEILKHEYDLFESLSNNKIPSEIIASKFLDKSISIFESYTPEEIEYEHSKLEKFIDNSIHINEEDKSFYNNVSNLIFESLKSNTDINTNLLFESFSNVLNKLTADKNKNVDGDAQNKFDYINENVLNIAIDKFNKKYSNLNENDLSLFKKIINSSYEEKNQIYEEFKNENLSILNKMLSEENDVKKINKAIENMNNIVVNESNIDNNIIKLYDLNVGLNQT